MWTFSIGGLLVLLCWWVQGISPCFHMPWVSICLSTIPSWCCRSGSQSTCHGSACSQISHSLYLSGFLSFSCLDRSVLFQTPSSVLPFAASHMKAENLENSQCCASSCELNIMPQVLYLLELLGKTFPTLRKHPKSMDANKAKAPRPRQCDPV